MIDPDTLDCFRGDLWGRWYLSTAEAFRSWLAEEMAMKAWKAKCEAGGFTAVYEPKKQPGAPCFEGMQLQMLLTLRQRMKDDQAFAAIIECKVANGEAIVEADVKPPLPPQPAHVPGVFSSLFRLPGTFSWQIPSP